jgi:hypothetical protein
MIEMACPSCGRAGQVPPEKVQSRLVCRKCHVVFHVDRNGRPVLGEPQSAKDAKKEKEGERKSVFEGMHVPTVDELTDFGENLRKLREYNFLQPKPIAAGVGILVFFWLVNYLFFGPAASIADATKKLADSIVAENANYASSLITDDSRDNLTQWYDAVHLKLETARKAWPTKEATVLVVVIEEDPRAGKGETEVFISPAGGGGAAAAPPPPPPPPAGNFGSYGYDPKAATAKPAAASGPPVGGPVSFHLVWVWTGGRWRLDARQSHALATR